ncbi:MAG: TerC family protein [Pseudomonadota bacterium]
MDFLFSEALGTPVWMWAGFLTFISAILIFDLGILFRESKPIEMAQSLRLSGFYISLGISFSVVMYFLRGSEAAFLYLTGYVVEQSLSMDNIFVIAVILNYFAIPRQYQHRVLFYGILGVIILRGVMIVAGAALIHEFHWVLHVFAVFLVFTGIKMLMDGNEVYDVESNPVLRFMRKHFRTTDDLRGDKFFVREKSPKSGKMRLYLTPLFVALCVIEVADVIFAVDSIPAIFAITTDPFIIFTSNIFAILGLRALFFALSSLLHRFEYLKYALSLVLVFIGGKILVAEIFSIDHISPAWSLFITLFILIMGGVVSVWKTAHVARKTRKQEELKLKSGSPAGGGNANYQDAPARRQ